MGIFKFQMEYVLLIYCLYKKENNLNLKKNRIRSLTASRLDHVVRHYPRIVMYEICDWH